MTGNIDIEKVISDELRGGILASVVLFIIGISMSYVPQFVQFGYMFTVTGVLALFATPMLRVAVSVFSFTSKKDWLYVAITAVVFIDIIFAVFIMPLL